MMTLKQTIWQGKTARGLPTVPVGWLCTATSNHWSNVATTVEWIKNILHPYCVSQRKALKLPKTFCAILLLDCWYGHRDATVLALLKSLHICVVSKAGG